MGAPADAFDISVVLTTHADTRHLRRTTRSLEACARFARGHGLKVELVLLAAAAPDHARGWISGYRTDAFDAVIKAFTDTPSVSAARHRGVELAKGKYVHLCENGDLFGFSLLKYAFDLAERSAGKAVVYPEYVCSFGETYSVGKLYPLDEISRLGFVAGNPFATGLFCARDHVLELGCRDADSGDSGACGDWRLATEALARGFTMVTAKDTAVYRRVGFASSDGADELPSWVSDDSTLFEPDTYLRACRDERYLDEALIAPSAFEIREAYATNRAAQEFAIAANGIEPGLDLIILDGAPGVSNKDADLEPGRVYHRVCELVRGRRFDQVVLLPFLTQGGGEKFILGVIRALHALKPDQSILILCSEKIDKPHWLDMLPKNTVLVDLGRLGERLSEDQRHLVCLRTIRSVAKAAWIHVKSCPAAKDFLARYGERLSQNRLVFYRFSDMRVVWQGQWVVRGSDFDFLSTFGQLFDLIVTDHSARAAQDSDLLDDLADRYRVLPNFVDIGVDAAPPDRPFTHRLLWASRLEFEKRPELLPALADALHKRMPAVAIDAYGSDTVGRFDVALLAGRRNLTYQGKFSGFASLPFDRYDGFLYTTAFDGMPNVVLESMAVGLTPIVPDVGGLSELVTDDRGLLIPNHSDTDRLVEAYVDAIETLYASETSARVFRETTARYMQERRGWARFAADVADVFSAPAPVRSGKADGKTLVRSGPAPTRDIPARHAEGQGEAESLREKVLGMAGEITLWRRESLLFEREANRLRPFEHESIALREQVASLKVFRQAVEGSRLFRLFEACRRLTRLLRRIGRALLRR